MIELIVPKQDMLALIGEESGCEFFINSGEKQLYKFYERLNEYDAEFEPLKLMSNISQGMDTLIKCEVLSREDVPLQLRTVAYKNYISTQWYLQRMCETFNGNPSKMLKLRNDGFFSNAINSNQSLVESEVLTAYDSFKEMWDLFLDGASKPALRRMAIAFGYPLKKCSSDTSLSKIGTYLTADYYVIDVQTEGEDYLEYLKQVKFPDTVKLVSSSSPIVSVCGIGVQTSPRVLLADDPMSIYLRDLHNLYEHLRAVSLNYKSILTAILNAINSLSCCVAHSQNAPYVLNTLSVDNFIFCLDTLSKGARPSVLIQYYKLLLQFQNSTIAVGANELSSFITTAVGILKYLQLLVGNSSVFPAEFYRTKYELDIDICKYSIPCSLKVPNTSSIRWLHGEEVIDD